MVGLFKRLMVTIISKFLMQSKRLINQKPTIISCKTIIGFGSPNKSGKASSHGAPLGDDEIKLVRKNLIGNTILSKYLLNY